MRDEEHILNSIQYVRDDIRDNFEQVDYSNELYVETIYCI